MNEKIYIYILYIYLNFRIFLIVSGKLINELRGGRDSLSRDRSLIDFTRLPFSTLARDRSDNRDHTYVSRIWCILSKILRNHSDHRRVKSKNLRYFSFLNFLDLQKKKLLILKKKKKERTSSLRRDKDLEVFEAKFLHADNRSFAWN